MPTILPINPSRDYKIAFVIGAPTYLDKRKNSLLTGYEGREFTQMLAEAGLVREGVYMTSLFNDVPPAGTIDSLCVKKVEADKLWQAHGNKGKYPFKALKTGKYLKPVYLKSVKRLHTKINNYKPNIIVALGNTALWALTGISGLNKVRGTLLQEKLNDNVYKILPTINPQKILKQWENRIVLVADLIKARNNADTRDYIRKQRKLVIRPTLNDIVKFIDEILKPSPMFSCDIETKGGTITCIGFGTHENALCIPFYEHGHYWKAHEEFEVFKLLRKILRMNKPIIFQNGMYDISWLYEKLKLTPRFMEDTMLLHHSMYPEMKKSLGFLSSLYTNEPSWKWLRPKSMSHKKES